MVDHELVCVGSDCTGPYSVTFSKPMTVKTFIEETLAAYSDEWGYIEVIQKNIFGKTKTYACKYEYGQIIVSDIRDDILAKEIKDVKGSGGWTMSDYQVYI